MEDVDIKKFKKKIKNKFYFLFFNIIIYLGKKKSNLKNK